MKKVKASGRSESDTPRNASQVPCNCGREDEREEQKGTKREPKRLNDAARNLDVAHQGAEGHRPIHKNNKPKTYACVLHWDGAPLTPTKIGKAKAMVRGGRATVVRHNPFTVQLTKETTKHAPEMTLGVDAGYSHVGYAIVSEETRREYFRGDTGAGVRQDRKPNVHSVDRKGDVQKTAAKQALAQGKAFRQPAEQGWKVSALHRAQVLDASQPLADVGKVSPDNRDCRRGR